MSIRPLLPLILCVSTAFLVTACGDDTTVQAPPDMAAPSQNDLATAGASFDHIFYVMMENHGVSEIIGNTTDAPYINQLAGQYAVANNYFGVTHPSLPNYLAAISGDFQGIWDDCKAGSNVTCAPEEFVPNSGDATASQSLTPAQITSATNQAHWFGGDTIVDQLEAKSLTWKAYMESIPGVGATDEYSPVDMPDGSAPIPRKLYAQKHNPFMYFSKIRNSASRVQNIVSLSQLDQDLASAASTPSFVWISPNQCSDMHGLSQANAVAVNIPNCAFPASGLDHAIIGIGDAFLHALITKIMASAAWSQNSAIVIVWDEDDYSGYAGCCGSPTGVDGGVLGGSQVPAIVILSKNATHKTVTDPFNHYSLLATIENLWGLPCLANACNVPGLMTKLFMP